MTPNKILSQALVGQLIWDEYARTRKVVRVTAVELSGYGSTLSDWAEPYIELSIADVATRRAFKRKLVFYKNEEIPFYKGD